MTTQPNHHFRLNAAQTSRLRSLMHMWYTPGELAGEIGISVQTIYRHYLPAGMPHRVDETGHIWIDGTKFAQWIRAHKRQKEKMGDNQAWCFTCRKAVDIVGTVEIKISNRYLERVHGTCGECGGEVVRARKRQ